jgi:hypothetical protein
VSSRTTVSRALRYAWAAPGTLIGLIALAACCATGGRVQRVAGTLEVAGESVRRVAAALPGRTRFCAITLGHVIVATDDATLARVRAHERVHVAQYERWGPLFIPLYLAAGAYAWLRGGGAYRDNVFEREARAGEQG